MGKYALRRLAKSIYRLTRRDIWLGGKGSRDYRSGEA